MAKITLSSDFFARLGAVTRIEYVENVMHFTLPEHEAQAPMIVARAYGADECTHWTAFIMGVSAS